MLQEKFLSSNADFLHLLCITDCTKTHPPPGKQWWHRDVSGSPDSALFSRLSSSHPHLVGPEGNLKVPPPFDREGMVRLRGQTGRVAVEGETGKVNQQIADS